MADLSKTIEIIFGGVDNLSSVTKGLSSEFADFDSKVQGVAAPVGNFTENLLKTEAAVLALGIAMVGVSIDQAGKFKGSIEEIGTLFNGTAEEVALLETSIKDYARNSTSSITEITEATYIAISTGTEWTEVNLALASSEELAVVGATDLATATGALSRTMNAYGLSADEAQRVSEALFTTVQNGDLTMEDLAANIGKVATTAHGAGVDLETLLAAVSAVTIAGVSTAESMTLLKALFKSLASPSAELTEALGGMSLETNTLQEIMSLLAEKTGGSLEEFTKLFPSIEASQAAMILGNDAAGAFSSTLEAMNEKTGKLSLNYEKMSETFSRINQTLVNNLKLTLIDAGIPLLDEYGTAVKAITGLLGSIGDGLTSPNFDSVYNAVDAFVLEFSSKIDEIATALPEAMAQIDFDDLIRAFQDVGGEIGSAFDEIFGDELDLSKPEDLAKALQAGVNLLVSFVDVTSGIIKGFGPIFSVLGEVAQRLGETSENTAKTTGEVLGALTLLKEFGTGIGAFLILLKESEADITNVFNTLEGSAKIVINAMQLAFDAFAVVVFETASTLAKVMNLVTWGDVAQDFRDSAVELDEFADAARENFSQNMEDMGESFDKLGEGLSGGVDVKDATQDLEDLGKAATDTETPLKDLEDTTGEVADALANDIPDSAGDTNTALEEVTDSTEKADTAGQNYKKTLVDGIPTFDQVGKAAKGLAVETDKAKESAEKMALEYAKLEVELEDIASNERIKSIEFFVDLEVAKVEADAAKVVAAFESVADSYQATTELIGNLYGELGGGELSRFQEIDLEKSIQEAEKLARDQWETQKKLIEAQIDQIEAATERTQRGDALIKVDGGDLQPELEAIMQSLFRSIRVKMSADYEDFLFGLQL